MLRFETQTFLGDNVIDNEEFEYVLSEFGISERISRQAFTIFTEVSAFSAAGRDGINFSN